MMLHCTAENKIAVSWKSLEFKVEAVVRKRQKVLDKKFVKNPPAKQETRFNSWVGKICWRRDRLPTPVFLGFPCGSAGKESACNAGDLAWIPRLGRSPGERKGSLLPYSGLENSCIVHGVANSQQTEWLSLSLSFPVTTTAISLEKEMATHSTILAWEISWTEEPGQTTVHGVTKSQTWLSTPPPP